ncbi:MAG: DinB family protein, partial [Gammaproteobacteria bacterium]
MQSLLEGMARYHAWASERLAAALAPVPAALLTQPRDLLFGSIDQTLAHLLDVDRLWYGRIARGARTSGIDDGGVASDETGEGTGAGAISSGETGESDETGSGET